MKRCGKCQTEKPVTEFYRRSSSKDGYQWSCKVCVKAYFSGWYEKNGDSVRARALAVAQSDPQGNRDRANAWNAANKDRHLARARDAKHKRRAQIESVEHERVDYQRIWVEQAGVCGLCDELMDWDIKFPDPLSKSVDHIMPISRGGGHVQENVQWAHLGCNLSKGARVEESCRLKL
jgi:5-methylcytosine-specific restriction endonuclease McrA